MLENGLIQLPKSEIVEAGYLESMLENFAASYKLFWLRGIFTEVNKGNRILEYRRLTARMIASAWYPVIYYNLSLGYSDKLAESVWYLHDSLGVKREEQEEKIVEFICQSEDKRLKKMCRDFTGFVPFRLLRPFYQRELEYEKKMDLSYHDGKVNAIIEKYNKKDQNQAFYRMDRKNGMLTVSSKWAEYLKQNASLVEGWLNYKLVEYIQKKNPNVPAIAFKIFPPKHRSLAAPAKFWELVGKKQKLMDLFLEKPFTEENMQKYGKISIDHFIPWSFVLHDELWNLYPMFKNVNSRKGNKLPDLDRYLEHFCECQYQAFITAKTIPEISKKMLEEYLTVTRDAFQIGRDDRGHQVFVESMRQTIEPLYQIANHQGYGIWWYE